MAEAAEAVEAAEAAEEPLDFMRMGMRGDDGLGQWVEANLGRGQ